MILLEDIPYLAYHFRADIAAAKPARVRAFRQRDMERALRAVTAVGLSVREITPDGRVILGDSEPVQRQDVPQTNPWDAAFQ